MSINQQNASAGGDAPAFNRLGVEPSDQQRKANQQLICNSNG